MTRDALLNAIETARQSEAFRNYLQVRDRVVDMLEEAQRRADRPSNYWEEELAGFDYVLDASPLIIRRLREHCYHITGLRSFEYRGHHAHKRGAFAGKLEALRQQDEDNLLVPESPLLGGFGHMIGGALINVDTLKFYECLVALNKAGLLAPFRSDAGERKVVMEIGAGWGGFAYQFRTLCPDVTYIIVDLPQTLLFSAVYLRTLFPSASVLTYGDKPAAALLQDCQSYDFVFLPHYFIDNIQLSRLDLTINMVSFQEMTSAQVDKYVRKVAEIGCPNLYSLNRDKSPYNDQLTTVSSIIGEYYGVREVKVLDVQYTQLSVPRVGKQAAGTSPTKFAKAFARELLRKSARKLLRKNKTRKKRSVHEYRHLVGTLNRG